MHDEQSVPVTVQPRQLGLLPLPGVQVGANPHHNRGESLRLHPQPAKAKPCSRPFTGGKYSSYRLEEKQPSCSLPPEPLPGSLNIFSV